MTDNNKRQSHEAIHIAAAIGFQASPAAYDRGRPSYPPESVAHLMSVLKVSCTSVVADLGAGTGKFTSLITSACGQVIAIEPVEAMRRKFVQSQPNTAIIAGCAEAIGLAGESVDAVVCAQAFHWFDTPRALAEIHRVLKPNGRLGLIWNVRDESVPWVARLTKIIDTHAGDTPRYRNGKWREAFEQSELFTPLRETRCAHAHRGGMGMVLDRVASISFIAALPENEKDTILAKTSELLRNEVVTNDDDEIEFPYVTHVFWCEKKA